MTRSYTKKGFTVTQGQRDPLGYFEDSIKFQNGSLILFRMPFQSMSEDTHILNEYGAAMCEMVFTTNSLATINDQLYKDYLSNESKTLMFDTEPTRITIIEDTTTLRDTSAIHPNRVHRIDWLLLSASSDVESTLKKIFEAAQTKKMRGGCCDFWRIGTGFDPTFFRFEPAKKKAKDSGFFTVEEGNFYFAY